MFVAIFVALVLEDDILNSGTKLKTMYIRKKLINVSNVYRFTFPLSSGCNCNTQRQTSLGVRLYPFQLCFLAVLY